MFEMNLNKSAIGAYAAGIVLTGVMLVLAPGGLRAQQGPGRGGQPDPTPTGPMANEKYKNIQALTNVSAAINMRCTDCHVQEASGEMSYEKDDKRAKQTARSMMKMLHWCPVKHFA